MSIVAITDTTFSWDFRSFWSRNFCKLEIRDISMVTDRNVCYGSLNESE